MTERSLALPVKRSLRSLLSGRFALPVKRGFAAVEAV